MLEQLLKSLEERHGMYIKIWRRLTLWQKIFVAVMVVCGIAMTMVGGMLIWQS